MFAGGFPSVRERFDDGSRVVFQAGRIARFVLNAATAKIRRAILQFSE
jgi:hypothetical protein